MVQKKRLVWPPGSQNLLYMHIHTYIYTYNIYIYIYIYRTYTMKQLHERIKRKLLVRKTHSIKLQSSRRHQISTFLTDSHTRRPHTTRMSSKKTLLYHMCSSWYPCGTIQYITGSLVLVELNLRWNQITLIN